MASDCSRDARVASVARRPVASFFGAMFAWSWGYWAIVGSVVGTASVSYVVALPGLWGPPIAAVVVTWLSGDRVGLFLRRMLDTDVAARWYILAVGVPVAFGVGTGLVEGALAGTGYELAILGPVLAFSVAIVAGGSEEIGLRGFAHRHLRDRYGAAGAGAVIGVLWAVWHVPLQRLGVGFEGSFLLFGGGAIAISIALGWLFDASGSALPVVLAHAAVDAPNAVSPAGQPSDGAVFVAIAATVVGYWALVAVLVGTGEARISLPSAAP